MPAAADLHRVLRHQGITPAPELTRQLGISPATLSRWTSADSGQIVRIGKTRGARYALHDEIEGIGARWPIWMIDPDGRPIPRGELHWLHGPASFWELAPGRGPVYEGLPPFIADMAPQGYLGRRFSGRFPELDLPPRLRDWQESHLFRALVLRGYDTPGNLVVGAAAMDRFLQDSPIQRRREDYPELSRQLIAQGSGSSAAGEFPKFCAYDGQHHLLVKFTAGDGSPADQRWHDLLRCEHHAAETLAGTGPGAVSTNPVTESGQQFLEIRRFDRTGERGRHPVITLGAVDDTWFGRRDDWPRAAGRLYDRGWITQDCRRHILLLDAFGRLIHNNDRHFGNLAFFWTPDAPEPELTLTPSYDMLPMALSPATNGMLPMHQPEPANPTAAVLEVWPQARTLADQFRDRIAEDADISHQFRTTLVDAI